jgi:hypothetical protein
MESGVQAALIHGMAAEGFQARGENGRQGYSAGGYSQQHQLTAIRRDFQHLGCKAIQGSGQLIAGENDQAIHAKPLHTPHPKQA